MNFFTLLKSHSRLLLLLCLLLAPLRAQTETNTGLPSPGEIASSTNEPAARAPLPEPAPAPAVAPVVPAPPPTSAPVQVTSLIVHRTVIDLPLAGALIAFVTLAGFIFYSTGLTRAKNTSHTATLLVIGVVFALIGYWMGGFAVESGGIGDPHAALAQPYDAGMRGALDHELGGMAAGHYWGLMGSAGFFLATGDGSSHGDLAGLFLFQAALMAGAVAAALGGALERGRLLAYAVGAFVIGAVLYPFFANWVWGGGWLAALGREYGLGHGVVDYAGAGVVHETAGVLALVISLLLGPRQERFGRLTRVALPGHHVPFILIGALLLLFGWITTAHVAARLAGPGDGFAGIGGAAALNTLLGAAGGMLIAVFAAGWRRRRPEPALICRGLLGGAIATLSGGFLFDPWAAFAVGAIGSLAVLIGVAVLERSGIDDPTGMAAVGGAGGAWGLLATGLFADSAAGDGLNGVAGPIHGAVFTSDFHQLAAQAAGALTCFVVVFILGFAGLGLIHRILRGRVEPEEELQGLDWSETGALGYQADLEHDPAPPEVVPVKADRVVPVDGEVKGRS